MCVVGLSWVCICPALDFTCFALSVVAYQGHGVRALSSCPLRTQKATWCRRFICCHPSSFDSSFGALKRGVKRGVAEHPRFKQLPGQARICYHPSLIDSSFGALKRGVKRGVAECRCYKILTRQAPNGLHLETRVMATCLDHFGFVFFSNAMFMCRHPWGGFLECHTSF
jgi:hypothetical protein